MRETKKDEDGKKLQNEKESQQQQPAERNNS